jgi:hypothetical protein
MSLPLVPLIGIWQLKSVTISVYTPLTTEHVREYPAPYFEETPTIRLLKYLGAPGNFCKLLKILATPRGFEPLTYRLGIINSDPA